MTTNKSRPRFYPPVEIDPQNEIRVLELLPGDLDDEIRCELTTHPLLAVNNQEGPANPLLYSDPGLLYEALSYTWGSRSNDVPIEFNGFDDFLVTPNLCAGLRRLRLPCRKRRLWADQICINQLNTLERNHQVAAMGRIFTQAARVLVWLGEPSDPPSELTEPVLKRLQATPYAEEMKHLTQHALLYQIGSWWTRSWVVQEYALARTEPLLGLGPYQAE